MPVWLSKLVLAHIIACVAVAGKERSSALHLCNKI
jgi:hypothetical protein